MNANHTRAAFATALLTAAGGVVAADPATCAAIADNTEGTSYTPNAEYNPPKPTEGEK